MKLSWGHVWCKKVTLCIRYTENHEDRVEKDGQAGEVSLISQPQELQEDSRLKPNK